MPTTTPEGFAALEPAMVVLIDIHPTIPLGTTSSGYSLNLINIIDHAHTTSLTPSYSPPSNSTNTIRTIPGFTAGPALDAKILSGTDWVTADPDNKTLRLDVRLASQNSDGAYITLAYTGICKIDATNVAFLQGKENATTTPFGNLAVTVQMQTGDEKYRFYEENKFVGSGRFVVKEGGGLGVEYRISRVVV